MAVRQAATGVRMQKASQTTIITSYLYFCVCLLIWVIPTMPPLRSVHQYQAVSIAETSCSSYDS